MTHKKSEGQMKKKFIEIRCGGESIHCSLLGLPFIFAKDEVK